MPGIRGPRKGHRIRADNSNSQEITFSGCLTQPPPLHLSLYSIPRINLQASVFCSHSFFFFFPSSFLTFDRLSQRTQAGLFGGVSESPESGGYLRLHDDISFHAFFSPNSILSPLVPTAHSFCFPSSIFNRPVLINYCSCCTLTNHGVAAGLQLSPAVIICRPAQDWVHCYSTMEGAKAPAGGPSRSMGSSQLLGWKGSRSLPLPEDTQAVNNC